MPESIRKDVAQRILSRAVDAGWDDLNTSERSRLYRTWSEDPDIGGVIAEFVPRDGVRVWIKDGPMKEYTRARRGLGPYAGSVPATTELEELIVQRVFGDGWTLKPGTIDVKPARFMATSDQHDEVIVLWGSYRDLKHLIWAWLNAPPQTGSRIVILDTQKQPVTSDQKAYVDALGARIGTHIRVVS